MLGLLPSIGAVYFASEKIENSEALRGKLAFVPQFSIAQESLTVLEVLQFSLDLCVVDPAVRVTRCDQILQRIGLEAHQDKLVGSLSGGQLRRLGLGLELVSDPPCLVCDEVTSGLDPRSENEILEMLQRLRDDQAKTFICIIHNLAKLDCFDLITVVFEGTVVFQGNLPSLLSHFEIPDALQLYDRLNEHPVRYWLSRRESHALKPEDSEAGEIRVPALPSMASQIATLLKRRSLLFVRDRGYWLLTLAITLGFPLLVTIFAMDGLPQLRGLALNVPGGFVEQAQENLRFRVDALESASLVTGLILFQVILLTLMGSNNGAREIAGERRLYEKERFAGLRPEAYAMSKIIFCSTLALIQGLWMTLFVKYICEFPGPLASQSAVLMLCCVSMTLVCLAFSAMLSSADKASLLSVYLVGFQLPLSGVVLALPDVLVWLCRPFINAYWGWGGYFGSMIDSRFYDAYRLSSAETIPSPTLACLILILHTSVALALVFWGCKRKQHN